jgi:predicted GH43/DUF377 family glycosyl hydrolase
VLYPNPRNWLEASAVFNPSVATYGGRVVMLYRALSKEIPRSPYESIRISTIFYAESYDGYSFERRRMFLGPEFPWESYSVEDPRVTEVGGVYYITYTAVASTPPRPDTVRLALATTEDFRRVSKVGLICPYNSKAGFVFPRRYDGRYVLALTLNPDLPPSRVVLVYFDKLTDLLDRGFWEVALSEARVVLQGTAEKPFVEIGTPPLELDDYWLLLVPDIVYEGGHFREFRVGAVLLDKNDPARVVARSKKPLLSPTLEYELTYSEPLRGVVFPSGIARFGDRVLLYYGAADRYVAVAEVDVDSLVRYLLRGSP